MKTFQNVHKDISSSIWDVSKKKVYGREHVSSYHTDSSANICYICKRFMTSNDYSVKKRRCVSRNFKYLYRVSA